MQKIDGNDFWFFALCALAKLKQGRETRGATLIPKSDFLTGFIIALRDKGVIHLGSNFAARRAVDGYQSDDVDEFYAGLGGPKDLIADAYEEDYYQISEKTEMILKGIAFGKFKFANTQQRADMIRLASSLGPPAYDFLLNSTSDLSNKMQRICDKAGNKKYILPVIIPFVCCSLYEWGEVYLSNFLDFLLDEHQKNCDFCRANLTKHLGKDWEKKYL